MSSTYKTYKKKRSVSYAFAVFQSVRPARPADEVYRRKAEGYRPREHYERGPELWQVLDQIASGAFSGGDAEMFRLLVQ